MGEQLHSFSFKDGIKRARKKCGYTQQSFSVEFGVCIETVRNWEQGRNIPDSTTLKRLCDFFHCNLDYLFFNIDCQSHDIQFITDKTGLSENVIKNLMKLKTYEEGKKRLFIIDILLQNSDFIFLMDKIIFYYHNKNEYIQKAKTYAKECRERKAKVQGNALKLIELKQNGEITTTVTRQHLADLENAKFSTLFKIQKIFEDILEETCDYIDAVNKEKKIEYYELED